MCSSRSCKCRFMAFTFQVFKGNAYNHKIYLICLQPHQGNQLLKIDLNQFLKYSYCFLKVFLLSIQSFKRDDFVTRTRRISIMLNGEYNSCHYVQSVKLSLLPQSLLSEQISPSLKPDIKCYYNQS